MPQAARVLFGGDLTAKWHRIQHQLNVRGGVAVRSVTGSPAAILGQCRTLVPCVLVVGEAFTNSVSAEEFCRFVDFGRLVRVLVETEDDGSHNAERLVRMGCVGVLRKDAAPDTAARALEVILAGELWLNRLALSGIVQNILHDWKFQLTSREREILDLLGEGFKNLEIAERLFISPQTVRWHLRSLYAKLGTHDRSSAVKCIRDVANGSHTAPGAVYREMTQGNDADDNSEPHRQPAPPVNTA